MPNSKITNLEQNNFKKEMENSKLPIFIDFWAPWCGPCKSVAPALEQLASKYHNKVKIAKVNVDDQPLLASRFNIMSLPTFIIFKNGRVISQTTGMKSAKELEEIIGNVI